jgi:hypothetical protein
METHKIARETQEKFYSQKKRFISKIGQQSKTLQATQPSRDINGGMEGMFTLDRKNLS